MLMSFCNCPGEFKIDCNTASCFAFCCWDVDVSMFMSVGRADVDDEAPRFEGCKK